MKENKWLETLKVNDKVIIPNDDFRGGDRVYPINKLTKTQIHVKISDVVVSKFRRDTGRSVGRSIWHTTWLQEATPEKIQQIVAKRLKAKLKRKVGASLNNLSLVELQKIVQDCNLDKNRG